MSRRLLLDDLTEFLFTLSGRLGNFSPLETVKFDIPLYNPSPTTESTPENDKVKLHEWKAYGYWARPRVNLVEVRNSRMLP